jgi:hypothetical protein
MTISEYFAVSETAIFNVAGAVRGRGQPAKE